MLIDDNHNEIQTFQEPKIAVSLLGVSIVIFMLCALCWVSIYIIIPLLTPCYSQKTDLSNERSTFLQFDATIFEPFHFQVGTTLKKVPSKKPYLY